MNNATQLLRSMNASGVHLYLTQEGKLGYHANHVLSPEEVEQLKRHKPQLIELLGAVQSDGAKDELVVPQCSINQQSLFFICQDSQKNTSYNLLFTLDFEQQPNVVRLQRALEILQQTQPSLRSGFKLEGGEVLLVRHSEQNLPFEQQSFTAEQYQQWLSDLAGYQFDLAHPPLWRAVLAEVEGRTHLVMLVHHIIWDGWSSALLRQLLDDIYGSLSRGEDLQWQAEEGCDRFAAEQQKRAREQRWNSGLAYWCDLLKDAPTVNSWLLNRRPEQAEAGQLSLSFGSGVLAHKAKHEHFNTLLSAWFVAFGRKYKANDVVLGVAVANRAYHPHLESSLGYCNNVIPACGTKLLEQSPEQIANQMQNQWQQSMSHHDVPFEQIAAAVQTERDQQWNPLTQVLIGYQSFNWDSGFSHLPHRLTAIESKKAKLPLTVQIYQSSEQIHINVEFDRQWYQQAEIESLLQFYQQAVYDVAADCGETNLALEPAWLTGKAMPLPEQMPAENVGQLLANNACRYPEHELTFIDAHGEAQTRSYAQLYQAARRIAGQLQQGSTWQYADKPVIIIADDLTCYVEHLWAVFLAGGQPTTINAPLTPGPDSLNKLHDAWLQLNKPVVICCDSGYAKLKTVMQPQDEYQLLVPAILAEHEYVDQSINPLSPAIIQLSSGSTGKSKCIQQNHKAILHYLYLWTNGRTQHSDHISLNWMGFDHVGALLLSHLRDVYLGCRQVHVDASWILQDPLRWPLLMSEYRVTHTWCPNFGFKLAEQAARESERIGDLSQLEELINAGEMVVAETQKAFSETFKAWGLRSGTITPAFGMAESCTLITMFPIDDFDDFTITSNQLVKGRDQVQLGHSEFVSLGGVIAGTEIRVVDDNNQLLSEYQVGRMQIRGPSVTMGYYRAPEHNAKAFVGDGWFDSGDCAVIANNMLYLTGRVQESIVINGINYFSHDIESSVEQVDGVRKTFVAAGGYQDNGDAAVVFFVAAPGADITRLKADIRGQLAHAHQFYPHELVALPEPEFLKTTSGKIQRRKMVERWLAEQQRLKNPIKINQLTWVSLAVSVIEPKIAESLHNLHVSAPQSARWVVALSEQDCAELATVNQVLLDAVKVSAPEHVTLIVPQAQSHRLASWAVSFANSTYSTEVAVVSGCQQVSTGWLLPNDLQAGHYRFDGALWQREVEAQVAWQSVSLASELQSALQPQEYALVTGASGGVARHLIGDLQRRGVPVVLLSRRQPQLENRSNSYWIETDITDGDKLAQDWQQACQINPLLNKAPARIYHLAARYGQASVETLTDSELACTEQVSVAGARALARVLAEAYPENGSHWIYFGSVNGLRGGPQTLPYNISSGSLRDLAARQRRQNLPATWIGWSAWQQTGMAKQVTQEQLSMAGLQLLDPQDCFAALHFAEQQPGGEYLIGVQLDTLSSLFTAPAIDAKAESSAAPIQSPADCEALKAVWQKVLQKTIDCQDTSFFELGGSSILLFKLLHHIEQDLGYQGVEFPDLFGAPTLNSMAAMLAEKQTIVSSSPGSAELSLISSSPQKAAQQRKKFKQRMSK